MFAKQIPAERATHICQVLQGMPEKLRRQYAAREAMQLGYGGISAVSKLTNISIPTIKKGLKEIQAGDIYQIGDRNRREGGGRRKASETFRKQVEKKNQQEGIQLETDINKVVNTILLESTYGNPAQTGRYTNITPGKVANEVNSKYGTNLSVPTFERVFINLEYSLQQNAKLEQVGKQHPLRDKQFRYREEIVEVYRSKNLPIISCDTKAKVKLGPFACNGREWRLIRDPRKKEDHDFAKFFREIYPNGNENLDDYFYSKYAIIAPYGVYCFNNNTGYVSLGISPDTSLFSSNSIFNWWESSGKQNFPNAEELLVLVDGGGSNRSSGFLWKDCMADIAIRMNLRSIQIFHHPPLAKPTIYGSIVLHSCLTA